MRIDRPHLNQTTVAPVTHQGVAPVIVSSVMLELLCIYQTRNQCSDKVIVLFQQLSAYMHQVVLVVAPGSVRPTDLNVKYLCLVMLVVVHLVVLGMHLILVVELSLIHI